MTTEQPDGVRPYAVGDMSRDWLMAALRTLVDENLLPEDAVDLAMEKLTARSRLFRVFIVYGHTTNFHPHQQWPASSTLPEVSAWRWAAEASLEYFLSERTGLSPEVSVAPQAAFGDRAAVVADFTAGRYRAVVDKFNSAGFGVVVTVKAADDAQVLAQFDGDPGKLLRSFRAGEDPDEEPV